MAKVGLTLNGLDRCPQCGIARPLLSYRTHVICQDAGEGWSFVSFVYQCSSCSDIVCAKAIARTRGLESIALYLTQSLIETFDVMPALRTLDDALPERPREYLRQATESLSAPDGAVMLAASAIDAMLKIKGLIKGTLHDRINAAVEQRILTEDMSRWAHVVRLDANKPRHADVDDPHTLPDEAKRTVEFATALGDFLFVFPARVAAGIATPS